MHPFSVCLFYLFPNSAIAKGSNRKKKSDQGDHAAGPGGTVAMDFGKCVLRSRGDPRMHNYVAIRACITTSEISFLNYVFEKISFLDYVFEKISFLDYVFEIISFFDYVFEKNSFFDYVFEKISFS